MRGLITRCPDGSSFAHRVEGGIPKEPASHMKYSATVTRPCTPTLFRATGLSQTSTPAARSGSTPGIPFPNLPLCKAQATDGKNRRGDRKKDGHRFGGHPLLFKQSLADLKQVGYQLTKTVLEHTFVPASQTWYVAEPPPLPSGPSVKAPLLAVVITRTPLR
jgi:hypothetical protein